MSASYPNGSFFWGRGEFLRFTETKQPISLRGNLTKHFTRRALLGSRKGIPHPFSFSPVGNPKKWASKQSWYGHVVTIGFLAEVDDNSPTWI